MMKPGVCHKHGNQRFITTSPKLCAAVKEYSRVDAAQIRVLRIESSGQFFDYFVDPDYLHSFGIQTDTRVVQLKDRNTIEKRLNDRIVIVKIMKGMKRVCEACLNEATSKFEKE